MITNAAAVQEVYVVKGDRARERAGVEDEGNREKSQEEAKRAKKNRNKNDEGDSGREEEDADTPSSDKRGRGIGSGSDSNKVVSKRSQEIDKYRIDNRSSDIKNGSKRNSGNQTLQVQGRG